MSAEEEALGHALAFLRAVDIGRGRCVSRAVNQRGDRVVAAATRVEALLCNRSGLDCMVEDACAGLKVLCEPALVLLLHTGPQRRRPARALTEGLFKALQDAHVLPRKVVAARVQVYGVMGVTASGHAVEVEGEADRSRSRASSTSSESSSEQDGIAVLILVIPKALAQVHFSTFVDTCSWVPRRGHGGPTCGEPFVAATFLATDTAPVMGADSDHEARHFGPWVHGGLTKSMIETMPECGTSIGHHGLTILWRRRRQDAAPAVVAGTAAPEAPVAAPAGRREDGGFSTAGVFAVANARCGVPKPSRRQDTSELLHAQREAWERTAPGVVPHVVAAFICNGRGRHWYGDTHVEPELLAEEYCAAAAWGGQPRPALFGIFCGGEIGPKASFCGRSSSSSSSTSDGSETDRPYKRKHSAAFMEAASRPVPINEGRLRQATRSTLQGYSTMVAVLG